MSEHRTLLSDTANKVFAALPAGFSDAWQAAEAAGLPWVMASEDAGGIGGGFEDAEAILYAAGQHGIALPIAEAIIGAALLAETGLAMDGPLTLARRIEGELVESGDGFHFSGTLQDVAFGQECTRIAAVIEQDQQVHVVCLARADARDSTRRTDPTDTPYDELRFARAPATAASSTHWNAARMFRTMALARACQIAGSIDAALKLSAEYVLQRQQFGRPLAKFQAIQQQMAVLVEEGAAAQTSARAAAHAADHAADRGDAGFEIASAKLRANRAAGEAASIAHQVHGAIGFTREYDLQRFTRRLWSWRSEYGNERHWADEIGARAARAGADGFWPALVSGFAS